MSLWEMSAVELASMVRGRQVSAREVLESFRGRIEQTNPELNAIVTLTMEDAEAEAARCDEEAARGEFRGPLHGLPIAIKDLAETRGVRTTFGSLLFKDNLPLHDAPHVANLRRAGAIVVGKTNTPEFGAGSNTFNALFGATRNPFDPKLTSGGSSGGAGAAVAAGMLPFADGSDLGASVRNPSAFCGLVGLRTTPGLVPSRDVFDTLGVIGPIARSAEDAALLLAGLCGTESGLPLARPDRASDFLDLRPAEVEGLRIAWTYDLKDLAVQRGVREVLGRARAELESRGCVVEDAEPSLSDADETFQVLRAAYMASLGPLLQSGRDQLKDTLVWNIEKGLALSGGEIAAAQTRREQIFRRMRSFLAGRNGRPGYDVLALPTVQVVPFPVEQEWVAEIEGQPQETYIDWFRSCSRITVTGHPAISIPAGWTDEGLPVGLQLVGPYGADRRLLEIAAALPGLGGPRPALPL